jgi:phosphatidylglycerol:prolipoprotein diacylglycerol transferase
MLTFLAESYLHDLDPFAIRITDSFGVRWYGLSYAAGFVIAWSLIEWLARTGRSPLAGRVGDLMFYVIAGVLIGGRVGYAAFYDPGLFIGFSSSFPFWDLLALNQGGMASHGGIIGVIIACMIFARRNQVSSLHLLDLVAFTCPAGLGLGRLANFVNGELWGRPLPDAMQDAPPWWSIKYPDEVFLWDPARPQDAERLLEIESLRGMLGGDTTFLSSVVDAARAGQEQVVTVLQPLLTAFYPSQIFQTVTDGPVLFGALVLVWLRPRKPGVVGAWFLIVYAALRLGTEAFRQPDAGVALLLGLSRGQVLSVAMLLAGLIGLAVATNRKVEPMCGLLPR